MVKAIAYAVVVVGSAEGSLDRALLWEETTVVPVPVVKKSRTKRKVWYGTWC